MTELLTLSNRAQNLSFSQTRAFDARCRALISEGKNVILFTLGEPDFPTPKNVKRSAVAAIKEDFTHYTNAAGILELRQAIAEKLQKENGLNYSPDNIVVSAGAANILYSIFQCIINPGDEVILPQPLWPTFAEQVKAASGVPNFVHCTEENLFEPTPDLIAAAITKNTRAVVLNSPCNPTGAMLSRKSASKIAQLAIENNFWIISDEIYEKISFDQKPVSPALYARDNTIVVNGVSKAYAMTGWRIGYAAGPSEVMKSIGALQSISIGNPNSIAQKAALAALTGPQGNVAKMRKEFRERRDLIVKLLNEVDGISCRASPGAFYAFANISKLKGKTFGGKKLESSVDVSNFFLDSALVGATPGQPFGSDNHLRFSFATSQEKIKEGIERIKKAVQG